MAGITQKRAMKALFSLWSLKKMKYDIHRINKEKVVQSILQKNIKNKTG